MTTTTEAKPSGPPKQNKWLLPAALVVILLLLIGLAFVLLNKDDSSADEGTDHSGATPEQLSTYQADLEAVGCFSGPEDGELSTKTEAAIKEFQQAVGLHADGELSDETKEELEQAAANGDTVCGNEEQEATDASATELEVWQHDLNVVGCWAGPVDGRLGPETEAAIRAFQQAANITVDGKLGPETEEALAADAAQGALICQVPGHRNDGRHGGGSTTTTTARPTTTTTRPSTTTSTTASTTTSSSTTSTTTPDQGQYEVQSGDPFSDQSDAQDRLDEINALENPPSGFVVQQLSDGTYVVIDPGPLSKDDADAIADQLTSNGIPASVNKLGNSGGGSGGGGDDTTTSTSEES
jgi:peptidoglycan hydrolase-like protein with peptidoglycan-binding domain